MRSVIEVTHEDTGAPICRSAEPWESYGELDGEPTRATYRGKWVVRRRVVDGHPLFGVKRPGERVDE
jgi:hypothetical protein